MFNGTWNAWVSDALRRRADHERRMKALDGFLQDYEAAHGEITDEEVRDATRRAAARAVVVRTSPSAKRLT
jgi:hypothetical protein